MDDQIDNISPLPQPPETTPVTPVTPPKIKHAHKFIFGYLGLILLVVAVGGVYSWQHNKVVNLQNQSISQELQIAKLNKQIAGLQTTVKKDTSSTLATTYTATQATALVQSAYNTTLTYEQKNMGVSQAEVDTIKSSLSTDLYNTLSTAVKNAPQADPILCIQALPDSLTASAGQTADGASTVLVNEVFGKTSTTKVTTTVDLSSLKITSITCPQ